MIKRGFLLFPTFFYSTRNQFSSSLASFNTALLLSVFLALSTPTSASKDLGEVNRYEKTVDLLGSVYLVSEGELLVCGKAGILGVLTPGQENASNIRLIDTGIKEDFLALSVVTQDEVLIGSSQGNIYRYKLYPVSTNWTD